MSLRTRQVLESVEHRRAELVEPRERELHLRLDACGARDVTTRGARFDVVEKCRLADARFAMQNEHLTAMRPRSVEQTIQCFTLARAATRDAPGMQSSHGTLANGGARNMSRAGHRNNGCDAGRRPDGLLTDDTTPDMGCLTRSSRDAGDGKVDNGDSGRIARFGHTRRGTSVEAARLG